MKLGNIKILVIHVHKIFDVAVNIWLETEEFLEF